MGITAVVTAAGKGERIGGVIPKQFLSVNGKPILVHTLEIINSIKLIDEIVLVLPERKVKWGEKNIVKKYGIDKAAKIVKGGEKRQDSVNAGLREVSLTSDIIVIHDGVRPFFSASIIEQAVPLLKKFDGVIEALPVYDTIKEVDRQQIILRTANREKLYRAQTPQIFNAAILRKAFARASKKNRYMTDEAGLVEDIGGRIKILRGSQLNIKITSREDLAMAKVIIKNKTLFRKFLAL